MTGCLLCLVEPRVCGFTDEGYLSFAILWFLWIGVLCLAAAIAALPSGNVQCCSLMMQIQGAQPPHDMCHFQAGQGQSCRQPGKLTTPGQAWVSIEAELEEDELVKALQPLKRERLLMFTDMRQAFGGFAKPTAAKRYARHHETLCSHMLHTWTSMLSLTREFQDYCLTLAESQTLAITHLGAVGIAERSHRIRNGSGVCTLYTVHRFEERLKIYSSLWCCVDKHPGHVWYDFMWDVVPHTDRHGREQKGPWQPITGP